VRLSPSGLDLGGAAALPLWAGAMHYWRHSPEEWRAGLEAIRSMGLRLVDTTVPLGLHETAPGQYDFGERNPALDVARFIGMAQDVGLHCILRLGPRVDADLAFFGLPECIVWDPKCQEVTPGGRPIVLPALPIASPVPNHLSKVFTGEVTRWLRSVRAKLSHLRWPDGPIVLVESESVRMLREAGFDGLPVIRRAPGRGTATRSERGRSRDSDLPIVTLRHRATRADHFTILRRTTEIVSVCVGREKPPFADVGAGFSPLSSLRDGHDSLYALMCGLAYGLRGFSLHMAVERDRWIGAPIDRAGRLRPLGGRCARMLGALDRLNFHTLRRRAPVCLMMPHALRPRATDAFGAIVPRLLRDAGWEEAAIARNLGLSARSAVAAEEYLRYFARSLHERGVPFGFEADDVEVADRANDATWVICATPGRLKPATLRRLRLARKGGALVTVGPLAPRRGPDLRGFEVEPLG
ncbi:MAG: beta-galactosidase, partial [Polyangiaceae bacterium]